MNAEDSEEDIDAYIRLRESGCWGFRKRKGLTTRKKWMLKKHMKKYMLTTNNDVQTKSNDEDDDDKEVRSCHV